MSLISVIKNGDIVALKSRTITNKELNEQDEHGNTALHYAMASGNWIMIKMLLDLKADMQIENKDGLTALQMSKPDSIRRMCVETQMKKSVSTSDRNKSKQFYRENADKTEVAEKMGFTSNTVRLKDGIENHSKIITDRLTKAKKRLSKVLIYACNYENCVNNADCIFGDCGHIVYCKMHGDQCEECPKCGKKITKYYQILPITYAFQTKEKEEKK